MIITPRLFGAYLKCPMKCWLLAAGEHPTGNTYATWVQTKTESYCLAEAQRLVTSTPSKEFVLSPHSSCGNELHLSTEYLKAAKWRLAIDVPLITGECHQARRSRLRDINPLLEAETQNIITTETAKQDVYQQPAWIIESRLHAIERIPSEGRGRPTHFIPIRFAFHNKLDNDARMLLAFDALVLAGVIGRNITFGKIVHGDKGITIKVKTSGLSSRVRSSITTISALLSSQSLPDLSLNCHCIECEFQDHCRKIATEKDDLSLLSNIGDKERRTLRAKGIFTVTQLSYIFRPRRHARKQSNRKEKYHPALKALAIREKKIHVVGNPELKIDGTPVYLDVEGLPDHDLYYLIGIRIGGGQSASQRSLWANDATDEMRIWNDFLDILSSVEKPVLIHYGSYETSFLAKMQMRYGVPPKHAILTAVIEHTINIVSSIYAKIYYPTYSNGLKDIARSLNVYWTEPGASGLTSIVWRHLWEVERTETLKQRLTTYNAEDCAALEQVTNTVRALSCDVKVDLSPGGVPDFVDVNSLKREKIYPFGRNDFSLPALEQINKAGYWDYQRSRIFLRTDKRVKAAVQKISKSEQRPLRINQTIELQDRPPCCPKCGHLKVQRNRWTTKTVEDLKFSTSGVKRWVVTYRFVGYLCCSCGSSFYAPDRPWARGKYGHNLRSYILYYLIELRTPQTAVDRSLNQLFGMSLPNGTSAGQKRLASKIYEGTYKNILDYVVGGKFMHADETKVSIDRHNAYVWVFANHDAVAYVYSDSREAGMVQDLLQDFKGVLVSDFYAAYDSIDCPQQKCLIHLIRDLNEDVFKHPFNDELKGLVAEFSELLKSIVETVDRFGLKARFLRKHKIQVACFNRSIVGSKFKTEVAIKYQKRFDRNANKLFTFLDYDNVPWNNNNAEHAIKPFAMLRHVIGGTSTPRGIREYLVLLSVEETCKYRGISFLDFLRSGELEIDNFSAGSRSRLRVGM